MNTGVYSLYAFTGKGKLNNQFLLINGAYSEAYINPTTKLNKISVESKNDYIIKIDGNIFFENPLEQVRWNKYNKNDSYTWKIEGKGDSIYYFKYYKNADFVFNSGTISIFCVEGLDILAKLIFKEI